MHGMGRRGLSEIELKEERLHFVDANPQNEQKIRWNILCWTVACRMTSSIAFRKGRRSTFSCIAGEDRDWCHGQQSGSLGRADRHFFPKPKQPCFIEFELIQPPLTYLAEVDTKDSHTSNSPDHAFGK